MRSARGALHKGMLVLMALIISLPPTALPALAEPGVMEMGLPSVVQLPDTRLPDASMRPAAGKVGRKKSSFVTAAVNTVGPAVVRIDTERLVDRAPLEGYLFPGAVWRVRPQLVPCETFTPLSAASPPPP